MASPLHAMPTHDVAFFWWERWEERVCESGSMGVVEWCDEHNYVCDIHLDDLRKVDVYFRKYYEEFKNRN